MTRRTRVLGIVGCEVLEDEIAHVVSQDPEASQVLVLECDGVGSVARKIASQAPGREVLCLEQDQLPSRIQEPGLTVVVWMEPIFLHQSPPRLRQEVMADMRRMQELVHSILIFYGLCGNAFRNLEGLAQELSVPVTILADENECQADDCTCALLGGTERYREFLVNEPGVYMLNTMWAEHWREYMHQTQMVRDPQDIEEARSIFEYLEYDKVYQLRTGLGDQTAFDRQVDEFASLFGLQKGVKECGLGMVERCYALAKSRMG